MGDLALLCGVLLCCVVGFASLALAMDVHWEQVFGSRARTNADRTRIRMLGWIALAVSLALALVADHASIAVLVWIMSLAAAALIVAFTLAWRPQVIVLLAPWLRR